MVPDQGLVGAGQGQGQPAHVLRGCHATQLPRRPAWASLSLMTLTLGRAPDKSPGGGPTPEGPPPGCGRNGYADRPVVAEPTGACSPVVAWP